MNENEGRKEFHVKDKKIKETGEKASGFCGKQ
jgi:hypothetical protein